MPDVAPMNGGPKWLAVVQALAEFIIDGLHNIFGFQYSDNEEHYIYQIELAIANAAAVGTVIRGGINIGQESDFICTRVTSSTRVDATGIPVPPGTGWGADASGVNDAPFEMLIRNGGSDRQLSNEPVDAFAAYGTNGGLPGIWSKPRLFQRSTRLQLELTLLKVAAAASTARVLFHGFKIYDTSSLDLTRTRTAA